MSSINLKHLYISSKVSELSQNIKEISLPPNSGKVVVFRDWGCPKTLKLQSTNNVLRVSYHASNPSDDLMAKQVQISKWSEDQMSR